MTVLPKLERELLAAHERTAARRRHARHSDGSRHVGGLAAGSLPRSRSPPPSPLSPCSWSRSGTAPRADHSVTTNNPSVIVLDPSVPHPGARLSESVATLERRFTAALPSVRVSRVGYQVVLRGVTASNRSRALALTRTGHLAFFDWEASVVTPNGKTVASQLKSGDATAVALSQGDAPGATGLRRTAAVRRGQARLPATGLVAGAVTAVPIWGTGQPRLCVGGECPGSKRDSATAVLSRRPRRECHGADAGTATGQRRRGHVLTVPHGTVVLQAADAGPTHHLGFDNPAARFFVLRNQPGAGRQRDHASDREPGTWRRGRLVQLHRRGPCSVPPCHRRVAHRGDCQRARES